MKKVIKEALIYGLWIPLNVLWGSCMILYPFTMPNPWHMLLYIPAFPLFIFSSIWCMEIATKSENNENKTIKESKKKV